MSCLSGGETREAIEDASSLGFIHSYSGHSYPVSSVSKEDYVRCSNEFVRDKSNAIEAPFFRPYEGISMNRDHPHSLSDSEDHFRGISTNNSSCNPSAGTIPESHSCIKSRFMTKRRSMRAPRMRWTSTLHEHFVHAVELLGGHESMYISMPHYISSFYNYMYIQILCYDIALYLRYYLRFWIGFSWVDQ